MYRRFIESQVSLSYWNKMEVLKHFMLGINYTDSSTISFYMLQPPGHHVLHWNIFPELYDLLSGDQ